MEAALHKNPRMSPTRPKAARPAKPCWTDVKAQLADFDRTALIGLVHDLYAASKDNQTFVHARFALGEDVLAPYKATIARWVWPDPFVRQTASVATAKKAITAYRKAVGSPQGLAELTVFYCEQATGFSRDVGLQDEPYFDALVRMFEQALKVVGKLPQAERGPFLQRLERVRDLAADFGYGVCDEMSDLLAMTRPKG